MLRSDSTQLLFSVDIDFPGVVFPYQALALEGYLAGLDSQIDAAKSCYRIDAERELAANTANLEPYQHITESVRIRSVADREVPCFIRAGAIVLIWGFFESLAFALAADAARREGSHLKLNDIRAATSRQQLERYFEHVLRIRLPWTESERKQLADLQALRNIMAHRNGQFAGVSSAEEKTIRALISRARGVSIDSYVVVPTSEYMLESTKCVVTTLDSLVQELAIRYGKPLLGN